MAEFVGGEEKLVNNGDPVGANYVVTCDFYHESYGESIGLIGVFSTKDKAKEAAKTVARELIHYDNVRYGLQPVDTESQIRVFVMDYVQIFKVNIDEVHGMSQISKKELNTGEVGGWPYPDIYLGGYIE